MEAVRRSDAENEGDTADEMVDPLVGVKATTSFYPAARSWAGGAAADSGGAALSFQYLSCDEQNLRGDGVL